MQEPEEIIVVRCDYRRAIVLIVLVAGSTWSPASGAIAPTYSVTFRDSVTGDNEFVGSDGKHYWTVDPGADVYQSDLYERPTVQSYQLIDGKYATNEYLGYIDITHAKMGWDSQYLYVAIDVYSRDKVTDDGQHTTVGMMERYGFRFSTDPDGRNGYLLWAEQPESEHGTVFGAAKTFGSRDTDGDVGGASPVPPSGLDTTKSDNPAEESGGDGLDGYDLDIIPDGVKAGTSTEVLWARVDPADDTIVELAFDYTQFGLTEADIRDIQYFDVEAIKGDPRDPRKYLWNDKYTGEEAGSPNPGGGGFSEFGTQGLVNIYELDTVHMPEPATLTLMLGGAVAIGLRRRRR